VAEADSAGHAGFSVTAWLGGEVRAERDETSDPQLRAYAVLWRAALRDLVDALAVDLATRGLLAEGLAVGL